MPSLQEQRVRDGELSHSADTPARMLGWGMLGGMLDGGLLLKHLGQSTGAGRSSRVTDYKKVFEERQVQDGRVILFLTPQYLT